MESLPVATDISTARLAALGDVHVAALNPEVFGFLTPDTLLAYCQAKIRGLDEQVQRAMAGQKGRGKVQEALGELSRALDANGLEGSRKGESGKTNREEILEKYDAAIAAVGPNTKMGEQLRTYRDNFDRDASGKKGEGDSSYVSREDMRGYAEPIADMQAQFNREGELEMIQLQALMSQRQTALQMCTNMIAGLGQSSQQIAANLGK